MAKFIDVIKYEGDNRTFIYRHPSTDFNMGTQLIVHQSQEAVLYKDGVALQSFSSGVYTLDTKNFPILKNVLNIVSEIVDVEQTLYLFHMNMDELHMWVSLIFCLFCNLEWADTSPEPH